MEERLLAINPALKLHVVKDFLTPQKCREILQIPFDYVMDCIDSITPKVTLLSAAYEANQRIVSSMGAGGKFDPSKLRVTDLFETYQCRFAEYVRKRTKRLGVSTGIKAVFSLEEVKLDSLIMTDGNNFKRSAYGTISYLPAAFGGMCASVVIRDLLKVPVSLETRPKRIQVKKPRKSRLSKEAV